MGVLYIIAKFWHRIYLKLNCTPSDVKNADYFCITDENQFIYLVTSIKQNFFSRNPLLNDLYDGNGYKRSLNESRYVGQEYSNPDSDTIVFYYKNNY